MASDRGPVDPTQVNIPPSLGPADPTARLDTTPGPSPLDPIGGGSDQTAETAQDMASGLQEALKEYHPLMSDTDLAAKITEIVSSSKNIMRASGIQYRARLNHNVFYARDGQAAWEENLRTDGENGDSIYVSVNILKNAIEHIMAMITSHRPVMDPISKNSDKATSDIVTIAKSIVDSKLHQQREINKIDMAVKHCPVLGAAFLHTYWDEYAGGQWTQPETPQPGTGTMMRRMPDGQPVPQFFKGDLQMEVLSILDVFYDMSSVSWETDVDDVVIRVYRNRYDLMVRCPEKANEIREAPTRATIIRDEYLPSPTNSVTTARMTPSQQAKVEVWIYYHKRTAAVPDGKMQIQLPSGVVLASGPMPKEVEFPIFRLCPDTIIGTAHGYAQATSSGGLQEALNIGASAMITNLSAFARRIILAQKGMGIEASDLSGDLKMLEVEFRPDGSSPVEPLDLLGDPEKIIGALNWVVGQVEQDTGANSIIRGDPKGVTAGVAINLYQAMAMQFASPLEAQRAYALEWYCMSLIRAYRSHPDVQREVQIIGKSKRPMLQNFYGDQLQPIERFVCDLGNPSSRTMAGRYQMAQMIKQDGVPVDPAKLVHLIQTGDWDTVVEGPDADEQLIQMENEQLLDGKDVAVMPGDDPVLHIRGHLVLAKNPEVRFDQAKLQPYNRHMEMHMQQMIKGDIYVKVAAGLLPMGPFTPPGGQPVHGDAPPPGGVQPAQQAPLKPKGVAPGPAQEAPGAAPPKPPPLVGLPKVGGT